ncbi:MAG: cysteine synthase A [Deltaproteobacteria bacterium]|nr:cysteine synthase A [Deltaproteobacteria bacterium]
MKVENILQTIGKTPSVRINRLYGSDLKVWSKIEAFNPAGSIKDRIALSMVEDAERRGLLKQDSVIIEPTSGNTGVGLAMVAAVKGYRLILVMPDSMSVERRRLITLFGAELELTPAEKGMKGSIERAHELAAANKNAWIPMQFDNQSNVEVHRTTTAKEVLEDFPEGLDVIITGVGTGGHITACAEVLKNVWPNLKIYAVEPELSAVLSGKEPGRHPLQGIGAGFKPNILKMELIDGVITVGKEEAFAFAARAAKEEGLLVGISSGASLAAVYKKAPELPKGSRVLTFSYDTGERYLSIEGLF